METSKLSGALLDFWVAHHDPRCAGLRFEWRGNHWVGVGKIDTDAEEVVIAGSEPGFCEEARIKKLYRLDAWDRVYSPSRDWKHGGPMIERDRIDITFKNHSEQWEATIGWANRTAGETPLIAAMRSYVRNKIGDEVPDVSAPATL